MLCRRLLLLKPLCPGLSGYARLQWQGGRTEMQIQLRGLPGGGVRFFWYDAGARELGQATVNPRGEAGLKTSVEENLLSPKGMQALLILSAQEAPKPLLLGLPGPADGGTLLELRAAALALCQQLTPKSAPKPLPEAAPAQPKPAEAMERTKCDGSVVAESPQRNTPADTERKQRNRSNRPELPREIFLPAIDPAPYMAAQERPPQPKRPQRPWADALPALRWPSGFETLRPYFAAGMPCALLDAPGWRFVRAADAGGPDGLFLGLLARDGAVRQLAYAHPGTHPPAPGFRPATGLDGSRYQVLWQQVG